MRPSRTRASTRVPGRPGRPPARRLVALPLWLAALALAAGAGPARADAAPAPARELEAWSQLQERIIEVSEQVKPLVVHIEAIVKVNDRRKHVEGSGFIVSPDGRIVTNHHVVDKAQKVEVTIPGRAQKLPAMVVGADKQTDVALLKVDPGDRPLPAATFGSVEELRVGQWVLAVGNPYGLDGTVSFGIVSAKGRNLEVDQILNDFIQTDAMIDRGSSGGPLVDLDGRVVGVNSRGQGRGIGFTIPIDTALHVVDQLSAGGVERGWMGITLQPLDRDLADYFGMPDVNGVIVNSVFGGSPADAGGLRVGDVIVSFGGAPVEAEEEEDIRDFQRRVAALDPGEEARMEVVREGESLALAFPLGTQPKVVPDESETDVGFHVREITEHLFREHRLEGRDGAYVGFVERGSPASESGLMPGDVIERVEDRPVTDLASFEAAMAAVAGKDRFLVTARRADMVKYLLVKRGAAPAGAGEAITDAASLQPEPPEPPAASGDTPRADATDTAEESGS